jgi:hypothetical protein
MKLNFLYQIIVASRNPGPVLSLLSLQLNFLNPSKKIPEYATGRGYSYSHYNDNFKPILNAILQTLPEYP